MNDSKKNINKLLPFGQPMAILTKSYYGALSKALGHLEIDRYYSVLILIEQLGKGCTQQYLCDELKIDKVSMVRIINYFIEKKFLKKIINNEDRRKNQIELTEKSLQILPEIHVAIQELNQKAFKGIAASKIKELKENIAHVQFNLDHLPTEKVYINYKISTKK